MTYTLLDAEAQAHLHPDTFHIPERAERAALGLGTYAKLCFQGSALPRPIHGERMWVTVTGTTASGRYIGRLNNIPVFVPGLALGDRIEFEPRHVLDIEETH